MQLSERNKNNNNNNTNSWIHKINDFLPALSCCLFFFLWASSIAFSGYIFHILYRSPSPALSPGVSDWSRWDSIYFMSKKSDVANTPFHISTHTAWSRKAFLTKKADIVVAVLSEILGYGWLCVKLSPGLRVGTQQCRFYIFDSRVWNYTCQPFLPFQGQEVTDLSDSICKNEYTGFLKVIIWYGQCLLVGSIIVNNSLTGKTFDLIFVNKIKRR